MKRLTALKSCFTLLACCLGSSLVFTSCGGGGGGGGNQNTDTAPATLDGLELFFVDGVPVATFQFAKIGGDASTAGGEVGYSNSIDGGGDGKTTTILDDSGFENVFDIFERMSNISYIYTKTGPNSGVIVINCQTFSNETGNVDIFANDDPSGSDITFTMRIVFGSSGGVIGEVAIEFIDVPVEAEIPTISYVLTSSNSTVRLQLQNGSPVPVGYDEADASTVAKKTPNELYPPKFSGAGIPFEARVSVPSLEAGGIPFLVFESVGVSSDDQGFGSDVLDQGVILANLTITGAGGSKTLSNIEMPYGWFGNDVTGSDTVAELRLELPGGATQTLRLEFTSIEQGILTADDLTPLINVLEEELGPMDESERPTPLPIPNPLPDVRGTFNFPFGDAP
jgi:hypothetical protein